MLIMSHEICNENDFLQMALLQGVVDLAGQNHSISIHNWFISHYGKNGCLLCEMGSKPVVDVLVEEIEGA